MTFEDRVASGAAEVTAASDSPAKSKMKLAFACPYYGNTPPNVHSSQRASVMNAAAVGHEWVDDYSTSGLQHRYACECMAKRAAEDDRIDALFWTEHDVLLPPFSVQMLAQTLEDFPEADMATGILFRRCEPFNPIISLKADLSREEYDKLTANKETCPDDRLKKVLHELSYEEMERDMLKPLRYLDTTEKPFACATASMGAVLFRRSVFQKMADRVDLFAVDERGNFSIDTAFFLRCYHAGLKLYCNPAVLCGHLNEPEVIGPDHFKGYMAKAVEEYETKRSTEIRKEHPEARIYGELTVLANKYGTDKGSLQHLPGTRWADWMHNYTPFYEALLTPMRLTAQSICEIGIWRGASLKMWRDFFPKATVIGIDNDLNEIKQPLGERILVHQANQASRAELQGFVSHHGPFDLIVDDGGHSMDQQQISLGFLFPRVISGGFYIVEDLHSSLFGSDFGVNKEGTNSTLHFLERLADGLELASEYMTQNELDYLRENTAHVMIHGKRSLTGVIVKTC